MAGQPKPKPAGPASGRGARAAAPVVVEEDMPKLVPCPIITAHPNGFVERTEPERETHEVRCVPPNVNLGEISRCFAVLPNSPESRSPPRPRASRPSRIGLNDPFAHTS